MIRLRLDPWFKLMYHAGHEPTEFNIVGTRNRFGRPNYFDDTISIYYKKGSDWKEFHAQATTRPGIPYLLRPVNPDGAAILVPGQYQQVYEIGLHRGKYEALIQTGPVKVYRDNNIDDVYDTHERTMQEGYFGINIHRASFGAKIVGVDSAGCQVIKDNKDFEEFMTLCKSSFAKKFGYTLVEI